MRREKKYLLTREQGAVLQNTISRYIKPDRFGVYLVQNLYYDTEDWDVIRASIEKPPFREKLRLRCYGLPNDDGDFFLELKKQYEGLVYKRRVAVPVKALYNGKVREIIPNNPSQISRELQFYLNANAVFERIFISYNRSAFAAEDDSALRITFDTDIRFRTDRLDFKRPNEGLSILPHNVMVMEVKTPGAVPLWLARTLSENEIYPVRFSKYRVCYTEYIFKQAGKDLPKLNSKPKREVKISA